MSELLLAPPSGIERRSGVVQIQQTPYGHSTPAAADHGVELTQRYVSSQGTGTDAQSVAHDDDDATSLGKASSSLAPLEAPGGTPSAKRQSRVSSATVDSSQASVRRKHTPEASVERKRVEIFSEEHQTLGFSLKDEQILENGDMLRRRLFPVGFDHWAKRVKRVSARGARDYSRLELGTFCLFCVALIVFSITCVFPMNTYEEQKVFRDVLEKSLFFPFRTRTLKNLPNDAQLVEEWDTIKGLRSVDAVAPWLYQVMLDTLVPTIKDFNMVLQGIRLTARRIRLVDTSPNPLSGFYDKRWAASGIGATSALKPSIEDTAPCESITYTARGGYRGHGGYVVWVDATDLEAAQKTLAQLVESGCLFDRQLSTLTIDFLSSNSYIPSLSYVTVVFTVDASGLVDYALDVETLKSWMQGASILTIIVSSALGCSALLLVISPIREALARGCKSWFDHQGIEDLVSLSICICGSVAAVLLYILRVISLPVHIDITNPQSALSQWLTSASSRITDGSMTDDASIEFNALASVVQSSKVFRTTVNICTGLTVFSSGFRLVRHISQFLSFRATVIIWVARYFLFPALAVFFFLICFTIGFSVMSYVNFGGAIHGYSTFLFSFLNSVAANFGSWVDNGAIFSWSGAGPSININSFFIISYYGLTFLILVLLVHGYETAAENMDMQLLGVQQGEKLYRYNWFHIRETLGNYWRGATGGCLAWLFKKQETSSINPSDDESLRHSCDSDEFEKEDQEEEGATDAISGSVETGPANVPLYGAVDPYGNVMPYLGDHAQMVPQYEAQHYRYQGPAQQQTLTSPYNETMQAIRWDWYDPYNPPAFWKPDRAEPVGGHMEKVQAPVDVPQSYLASEKRLLGEMERINKEFFSENDIVVENTGARPNLNNMNTYVKIRRTRHTRIQLAATVLLAFSALLLALTTFVAPTGVFYLNHAVRKALLTPTYKTLMEVMPGVNVYGPVKNFATINSRKEFINWIRESQLYALFSSETRGQSGQVFNEASFASGELPTLLTPWACGLSTASVRLGIYRMQDRHTGNLNGPYVSEVPADLEAQGFVSDRLCHTGGIYRYLPTGNADIVSFFDTLIQNTELVTAETAKITFAMLVMNINTKHMTFVEMSVLFRSSGIVVPQIRLSEIHSMFWQQKPKVLVEPAIILFILTILVVFAGELYNIRVIYVTERDLRRRVANLRGLRQYQNCRRKVLWEADLPDTISVSEAVLIYFFEKSFSDVVAFVLAWLLFGTLIWGSIESNVSFSLPVGPVLIEELYHRLGKAQRFTEMIKFCLAWLMCFAIVRLTDLFRGDKRFGVFTLAIAAFFLDFIFAFVVVLALVMGFGFIMFLSFGDSVEGFQSFTHSLLACFWIITGQFDFQTLFSTYPLSCLLLIFPLWALLHVAFLNIFTAIFVRSFSARVAEAEEVERLGLVTSSGSGGPRFCRRCCDSVKAMAKRLGCWSNRSLGIDEEDPDSAGGPPGSLGPTPVAPEPRTDGAPRSAGDPATRKRKGIPGVLHEDILSQTRLVHMSDRGYQSLSPGLRVWAEDQVLQLIDRFRKLSLGLQVYGGGENLSNIDTLLKFTAALEDRAYTELRRDFRSLKLLEGKLRHRLNVYENVAKGEQDDLEKTILHLENEIEEVEADIKEAQEEYDTIKKKKRNEHIF